MWHKAQTSGMMAVAGSFKKHPLSGGRLTAKRLGVIALGEKLLAVNDVVRNHYIFLHLQTEQPSR